MKHTQGEWMLPHFASNDKKEDQCQCGFVLNEQYCGAITTVHFSKNRDVENGDNPLKDEAIANAKLICAAPDLLHALQNMLDVNDSDKEFEEKVVDMVEAMKISKDAIIKATK